MGGRPVDARGCPRVPSVIRPRPHPLRHHAAAGQWRRVTRGRSLAAERPLMDSSQDLVLAGQRRPKLRCLGVQSGSKLHRGPQLIKIASIVCDLLMEWSSVARGRFGGHPPSKPRIVCPPRPSTDRRCCIALSAAPLHPSHGRLRTGTERTQKRYDDKVLKHSGVSMVRWPGRSCPWYRRRTPPARRRYRRA